MRSGWPHTQDDHGRPPADQRRAPFGPDVSWPTGYSELEYRDGDYRYAASQAPTAHGADPYAGFTAAGYGEDAGGYGRPSVGDFGYGDPGYSDPGYDGPASQDTGIAGTRTVRGFVENGQGRPAHALPPAPESGYDYPPPGYDEPGHIELAYPLPYSDQESYGAAESYQASDTYRQPWDYDQPLRYDGETQGQGDYGRSGGYPDSSGYGPGAHRAPDYNPAGYNGSDMSRPGIDGPGYDLSGIIGTGDFPAVGYDEPSYGRLSYDDPRYDQRYDDGQYDGGRYDDGRYDGPAADTGRHGAPGPRFDETRFDMPRFDETRLDSLWLGGEEGGQEYEPEGYGNDGFDTDGPFRSGQYDPPSGGGYGLAAPRAIEGPRGHRFDETRLDMLADDLRMDHTRFDVPVFDDTRIDNMRALMPAPGFGRSATGLLPPPERQPLSWPDDTALDSFTGLDLDDEPAQFPAAFVRTQERPDEAEKDLAPKRSKSRRSGRTSDRRQWMALGAIAVVAAGAIGGVLMKYVFSGPSGPAHSVAAPNHAGTYTRMANLEKQMKVDDLRAEVIKTSAGQASGVVSAVYQEGSSAPGSNPQIFMFVGGKLSSAAPSTSIANFIQTYPGAAQVSPGSLGGQAACAEAQSNGEGVAMCVWFDNDSFGELVSPTMTTAKLASTLDQVRPNLELYAK